jgi:hypothetical protein
MYYYSQDFSNAVIPEFDPRHVQFWIDDDCSLGFAYIAVSQNFDKVKWLIAVFMIEKLIYATHWTKWILITKLQMY